MRTKLTCVALLVAATTSPVIAQDKTINGVAVPPDQMEKVQARCEELIALKPPVDPAAAADLPAAGASDDAGTTESAAETPVAPAAPENTEGNMAADTPSTESAAKIDLKMLTSDVCEAGGFQPADGAISPQGNGALTTAKPVGGDEPENGPTASDALAGPGAAGAD